jgi:hypothetical protein
MAAYLEITPDALRKWRISGRGPPFVRESAHVVIYPKAALLRWLRKNQQTKQAPFKRRPRPKRAPDPAESPGAA